MLLTISFSVMGDASHNEITILRVDGDNTEGPWDGSYEHPFQHIQDAINHSSDEDIIYVEDGIYYENIIIDKSIRLKSWGEDPYDTIIHGMNTSKVVTIDASYVMISGFTIENATSEGSNDFCIRINYDNSYITIKNNILRDFTRAGIYCYYHSSYLTIEENEIIFDEETEGFNGIELSDSMDSRIKDNIFYGEFDNDSKYFRGIGIELYDSYSIVVENNQFNDISNAVDVYSSLECEIISNNITELHSGIHIIRSTLNLVSNNTISLKENGFGVLLLQSWNNNISYNIITGADEGIMMENAYENIVYRNNLEANKKDASFWNHQFKPNIWKENYWGRDKLFPKIIVGHIGDYYDNFRWFNIDWHPSSEPYDIDI